MTDKWSYSDDACEMLVRQKQKWGLLKENFEAFKNVKVKNIPINGINFKVQFNPARIISTNSQANHVNTGNCFLCQNSLPQEQEALQMGDNFLLLCNPYPIFPEHFTVASKQHIGQNILIHFMDFLKISKCLNRFTVFYNGPQSGASAPNHLHFQAVTRSYMPADDEIYSHSEELSIPDYCEGKVYLLLGNYRNCFQIEAESEENVQILFRRLYKVLEEFNEKDREPMMNVFCQYSENEGWKLTVVPRTQHRPRQFFAEGDERIVASPGAADIGGVLITPREEDFLKMDSALIVDIYTQICYSDIRIMDVAAAFLKGTTDN